MVTAFRNLIALVITLLVPITLTLFGVRLMMTSAYLSLEYNRADFPPDDYGFTVADRLKYGPYGLDYLVYNHPVSYLGDLRFGDGRALFNGRELGHMDDVQKVTRTAFVVMIGLLILQVILIVALVGSEGGWVALRRGLLGGALLTILILIGVVVTIALAWDTFFTGFHQLFFANGTWTFEYTDTLIRLYPVRFWQDTAINIGVFAGVGALLVGIAVWRLGVGGQGNNDR